jgi:hypothetical protein
MDGTSEGGSVGWVADEGDEGGVWLGVTTTIGVTVPPSPTPDPLIGISQQLDSRGIEWQVPYIGDQPWEGPQNLGPLVIPVGYAMVKGVMFIAHHIGGETIKSVTEGAGTVGVETALDSAKKHHKDSELLNASRCAKDQVASKWSIEADDVARWYAPLLRFLMKNIIFSSDTVDTLRT